MATRFTYLACNPTSTCTFERARRQLPLLKTFPQCNASKSSFGAINTECKVLTNVKPFVADIYSKTMCPLSRLANERLMPSCSLLVTYNMLTRLPIPIFIGAPLSLTSFSSIRRWSHFHQSEDSVRQSTGSADHRSSYTPTRSEHATQSKLF